MRRRWPWAILAVGGLSAVSLSGCDSARSAFGFERSTPDEFAVVSRQPLSIPPDFRLRPPEPGAPRPQEVSTRAQTEALVLGTDDGPDGVTGASPGEAALLSRSGADQAPDDIRRIVDRETSDLIDADDTLADSILFWREEPPPGTVLDPVEEARLLREAELGGQPIGDTQVPVIERRESTVLDLF